MKIAQIVCAYPPYAGGIGNSAHQIARLLGDEHAITNYTPQTLKPWLKYGHGAFLPQLLFHLGKFDYIYLHYPFFGAAEIVWLYKILGGKSKLIIHYHMDVKNLSLIAKVLSCPSRLIRNQLFNQAEIIISASLDYVKSSQIKKYYSQNPDRFREIPFGLDLQKFQPKEINQKPKNIIMAKAIEMVNLINEKFIKKNKLNLLFVGGLDDAHYFKGVAVLLSALSELDRNNWQLKIVGDGNKRQSFENLSSNLNIRNQITFAGKINNSDLIKAYQEADLLILPSINSNEAFGIVIIEALACGVPVIASDLPGVRSVFTNSQEGLLCRPNDSHDLKDKLQFILDHEEKRKEMSQAARRLAEKKYDELRVGEKLKQLFK